LLSVKKPTAWTHHATKRRFGENKATLTDVTLKDKHSATSQDSESSQQAAEILFIANA
jgi:hypothetical protein